MSTVRAQGATGGQRWREAIGGALAGAVGTWLMDLVTTGLLEQQSRATTEREEAARPNGKGAVDNLVYRLEDLAGRPLTHDQRRLLGQAIHFGLGIAPGAAYALLRRRLPMIGAGRGLAYGLALWAVNDEYLNTKLGLAGPFGRYPLATHWRGLVGHAVLGMATDSLADGLSPGGRPRPRSTRSRSPDRASL